MADVIRHKRSATAAAVPSAGQLELGELAINVADGRLYFKTSGGAIIAVANLTDAWALQPIGVPFPIQTHLTGVSTPPTDNPNYRYIKLTASDSYNTGVLTSESVSGSAPLVQATAVISDSGSPLNGQAVRLINTERRFIRAGDSGVVQGAAYADHTHAVLGGIGTVQPTASSFGLVGASSASLNVVGGTNDDSYHVTGSRSTKSLISPASTISSQISFSSNETRPVNIGADYYMRIR